MWYIIIFHFCLRNKAIIAFRFLYMRYFSTILCPLCKAKSYQILYRSTLKKEDLTAKSLKSQLKNSLSDFSKHGRIVKCRKCNLVYVNPKENEKSIIGGYTDVIDPEYLETEKFRKDLFKKHYSEICKFKKKGALLDVGCFCGFFLELTKKRFESFGVEPSSWATKIATKRGARIIGKSLDNVGARKFDVITVFDVIEHLSDPKKELIKIKKLLNNKGVVAIGTPNIESLTVKVLGSKHPFFIRMHVVLFSKKTLTRILDETGFNVKQITYYGRTYPLSYYLERLIPITPFLAPFVKILNNLKWVSDIPITINLQDEMLVVAEKKEP